MKTNRLLFFLVFMSMGLQAFAQADSLSLQEVVVTGTRNAVDVRYLPMPRATFMGGININL